MSIDSLLAHRLLMVTGKGGTGKSTFAAAFGRLAADRGRRTVVVEVDVQRPSLGSIYGVTSRYQPVQVAKNLSICNLDWHNALEEWLERTVPGQRVVKLILHNPIVSTFLDATPGAREVVILSKIATLTEQFDMVVVDMPASGHALGVLRVPTLAMRLMAAGPIRKRAEELQALFGRRDVGLVLVALPEEMVVNETVETWANVRREAPQLRIPAVALNRAASPSLTEDERLLLARLSVDGVSQDAAELLLAGRWEAGLESDTADALSRLKAEIGGPVLSFPRLGTLGGFEGGAERVVQQMTAALARQDALERRA